MKKLLYIPAVIFFLSGAIQFVLFTMYTLGLGFERNAGEAALAFIFTITGLFAGAITWAIATYE